MSIVMEMNFILKFQGTCSTCQTIPHLLSHLYSTLNPLFTLSILSPSFFLSLSFFIFTFSRHLLPNKGKVEAMQGEHVLVNNGGGQPLPN